MSKTVTILYLIKFQDLSKPIEMEKDGYSLPAWGLTLKREAHSRKTGESHE
jgi:hypothetical protein